MIDLHTHVLFGIDDGAREIENSIDILHSAQRAGIKKMALTPHFSIGDDLDEFLKVRDEHFLQLEKAKAEEGISIDLVCGAEVYITDELYNETDLKKLVIGKSNTVLAEFKYHGLRKSTFLGYIDEMLNHGVDILIAHVERYSYVRESESLIYELMDRDVKLQVNAVDLFEMSEEGEFARMLLKNNLVFAIGSDVHHVPSQRLDSMKKLGGYDKWKKYLVDNPGKIFSARG